MTHPEKLRQSIEAVSIALGKLAASAEPYFVNAAGDVLGSRITIEPEDEAGPWREACDMISQAREEARQLEVYIADVVRNGKPSHDYGCRSESQSCDCSLSQSKAAVKS
jgi:hypothetical protein